MSHRSPEALRSGITVSLNYNNDTYQCPLDESMFTSNYTVLQLKLSLLEQLEDANLNQAIFIVRDDDSSEEIVLNDNALMVDYHTLLQESVHLELRPPNITKG